VRVRQRLKPGKTVRVGEAAQLGVSRPTDGAGGAEVLQLVVRVRRDSLGGEDLGRGGGEPLRGLGLALGGEAALEGRRRRQGEGQGERQGGVVAGGVDVLVVVGVVGLLGVLRLVEAVRPPRLVAVLDVVVVQGGRRGAGGERLRKKNVYRVRFGYSQVVRGN